MICADFFECNKYLLLFIICAIFNGFYFAEFKYSIKGLGISLIIMIIEIFFLLYYLIEAIFRSISGKFNAVSLELIILISGSILFYFLVFKPIFKKKFTKTMSKTISNIKLTALWEPLMSALKNNPLCPIFICKDGVAVKKRQDEYYYINSDEIISLGKVIKKEEKKGKQIYAESIATPTYVNTFENHCEIIKFSQYNLSNLDVYNMNLLGHAIAQICAPIKYNIREIYKRYNIEEWKYEPGSSGSITKIGDSYTIHPPTEGTSRYVTETIHSVIKYVVVYPEPQKPKKTKNSKKEPKVKEKSWL